VFYRDSLAEMLAARDFERDDRVLVVCGGELDKVTLAELGFTSVVISNLDEREGPAIAPFAWARQDAENLSYADGEFDVVMVHAGLHHCHSPHRALLEMVRVARKCVVVFEARDSLMMRLAVRFGFTFDYELEAVTDDNFEHGGVANGPVPNFVYRWTEREIEKTVASFDPGREHVFRYFYGLRVPIERLVNTRQTAFRLIASVLTPALRLFTRLVPTQCNEFAFSIGKTGKLKPWMESEERVSKEYAVREGRMYVAQKEVGDRDSSS